MRYRYEQDPGHGWLGVPVTELVTLGIAGEISNCSYYDRMRAVVWLEEDCDMSTFLSAKLAKHRTAGEKRREAVAAFFDEYVQSIHVNSTLIRSMPSYGEVRDKYADQARRAG